MWTIYRKEKIADKLYQLEHELCQHYEDTYIAVGYMSEFEYSDDLGKDYMIGRLFKEEPSNCEGLEVRKLQSTQMTHAKIVAKSIEDIIDGTYALTYVIAQKNGYRLRYQPFFWLEYYSNSYFSNLEETQKELVVDFYFPCQKLKKTFGGIQ